MDFKTNNYCCESIGEVVSQVYEVEANTWDEAKKVAFPDMTEGDILAECPPKAVKEDERYSDYHYIDKDMCTEYAILYKGTWANSEPSGAEYWEDRVWYFSDDTGTYLNDKGEEFTDWKQDEKEDDEE